MSNRDVKIMWFNHHYILVAVVDNSIKFEGTDNAHDCHVYADNNGLHIIN